jgi:hypothetical protein
MLARSATRSRHQNAPRPAWKVAEAFKQWLRGRPCACAGRGPTCSGKVQSAHVDYAGGKGTGTKVADRNCIPLSEGCHRLQHDRGWPWFDQQVLGGVSRGLMLSAEYWRAWPGRAAWEKANG